jgi:hypothetical protein
MRAAIVGEALETAMKCGLRNCPPQMRQLDRDGTRQHRQEAATAGGRMCGGPGEAAQYFAWSRISVCIDPSQAVRALLGYG